MYMKYFALHWLFMTNIYPGGFGWIILMMAISYGGYFLTYVLVRAVVPFAIFALAMWVIPFSLQKLVPQSK